MKISDLYPIAKLAHRFDEQGFIKITFTKDFDDFFKKFRDVFLLFKDYSVRYVTIEDVKYERGYKIKLLEKELNNEIMEDGKVKVCLENKDVPDLPESILYQDFDVYSNNKQVGKILGVIENKMQNIFLIELDGGKEITIPNVDYFVDKTDIQKRIIYIKNYEELLDI